MELRLKRGRPSTKTGKCLNIRASDDIVKIIDAQSSLTGKSKSDFIEDAIRDYWKKALKEAAKKHEQN